MNWWDKYPSAESVGAKPWWETYPVTGAGSEASTRGSVPPVPSDAQTQQMISASSGMNAPVSPPSGAMPGVGMANLASKIVQPIVDFAGRKPAEDLPELGGATDTMTSGQTFRMALANVAERDPEKLGEILKAQVPGSTVRKDKDGAIVAKVGGKEYYLNRPGPSTQDVMDLVSLIPLGYLIARGAGAGGAVAGTAGRIIGAGVTAGAGSLGEDVGSHALGSSREVSPVKAATTAALAMLFEGGAAVFNAMKRADRIDGYFDADNALTPVGKKAVTKMGLDPEKLTPEVNAQLRPILRSAADPQEALRLAEAKGINVPLTKGQVSQEVTQQARESAMTRGAMGQEPSDIMTGFQEQQQQALKDAARTTQTGVGGVGINAPGEGMAAAQARMAAEKAALKGQVTGAYEAAREKSASLSSEGLENVGNQVRDVFKGRWNPLTAPKANGMVDQLRPPLGNVTSVKINALENWRQQVAELARSSDPVEAGAAKAILGKFDDAMLKSVDDAMIRGDQGAVEAFKTARSLRYQLFNRYEANKIVSDIIKPDGEGLAVTPSEAVNKLFGAGSINKFGTAKALGKIRDVLGQDSLEWKGLKEEAFLKLLKSQGPDVLTEGGRTQFSGAKFATDLDKALRDSPEVMRILFTPKDIARMQQLKRVALSATESRPGAVNFSNTTIVNKILGNFGWLGKQAKTVVETTLRPFLRTGATIEARQAIKQPIAQSPLLGPLAINPRGMAAGYISGRPEVEQYRRLRGF